MRNRLLPALAAAALLLPGAVSAQANNDNIQALATVVSPITVLGQVDLDFGTVFPGVNKTVAPTEVSGPGRFDISGNPSSQVLLDFGTLPTDLASGGDLLPISFGAASAAYGDAAPAATFDPTSNATPSLTAGGNLSVWIGGTVAPLVTQPAGDYAGTITLTVTYTGN